MSNRNDITGDVLITRELTQQGKDNWDKIFPSKNKKKEEDVEDTGSIATKQQQAGEESR